MIYTHSFTHEAGFRRRDFAALAHVIFLGGLLLSFGRIASAQSAPIRPTGAGEIEFDAQAAPSGARPEPVRQLTFYLLRKSVAEIRAEAAAADPPPKLAQFVDSLTVSPELKSWMKKHQTVQLGGANFNNSLTPSDIVEIPEFYKVFMLHASDFASLGFPKPKFKPKDATANPEKYKQEQEQFKQAVAKFITAVPDSAQGMDVDLNDINPYPKWVALAESEQERVEKRAYELAQTLDLVAQTDSNLDGRGAFSGIAPGEYWIATLDRPAIAGDVRLGWDVQVTVRAGEVARVALSNLNAALR